MTAPHPQAIPAWVAAEFDYASRLRKAPREQRRALYFEAYDTVSKLRWGSPDIIDNPELRTAGTSRPLAEAIASLCNAQDRVLEIGCGRGLTAMIVAPHVQRYVVTDVSQPSLDETTLLLQQRGVEGTEVVKCSAMDLDQQFPAESFTKAVSIDVIEHLHPHDATEHYQSVHRLLVPGGQYFIVTPNVLTGPHDVTRTIYPDALEPLGFHLNESSFTLLDAELRRAGFSRCFALSGTVLKSLARKKIIEKGYRLARRIPRISRRARSSIGNIKLVAQK